MILCGTLDLFLGQYKLLYFDWFVNGIEHYQKTSQPIFHMILVN